ncbi:unnamed protein product, partial [Hapterophycus canaliculatus]
RNACLHSNVWCKDLAAAATAVFRNRAALAMAPGSLSSPSNHRRSSSTSSDLARGEGRSRAHSSSSSSLATVDPAAAAASTATGGAKAIGDGGETSADPSPGGAALTAATAAAAAAAAANDRGVAPTLELTRVADPAAVATGAAFSADGSAGRAAAAGGRGGRYPFSGHTRSIATVDEAFVCEGFSSSSATAAAAAGPMAHQPPLPAASSSSSRSLYNRKDAAGGLGGSPRGGAPSSPSPPSRVPSLNATSRMAHSASPLPETPPPPPSRRGGRISGGGGSGGALLPHGDIATAAKSPPRTHRRGGHAAAGSGPWRGAPSGGQGCGGRRLIAGRWVGCPHPDDIERVMEQRARGERGGLVKLSAVGGGGGCGVVDPATVGQSDPWRDCAKDFGVRSASLTQAFAPVAMLLRFDGGTGFDKHLQTEYAAENLWFWKQAMEFRSAPFPTPERRREEARRIYDAFLSEDSPDQVGLRI